jgi:hypothetical protein
MTAPDQMKTPRIGHARDLMAVEAEHVAQHERRGLAGRQVLQAGDEGQLDRLGGRVAGAGPGAVSGTPSSRVSG